MSLQNDNAFWREAIPEGWRPLFDQLLRDLETMVPDLEITQVKEKFGELRVYVENGTMAALDRIDEATKVSKTICEQCGRPAALTVAYGYYRTLCPAHMAAIEAELVKPRDEPISVTIRVRRPAKPND